MTARVYTQKTETVEEALSLATQVLDIPESASISKRLQSVMQYFIDHTKEDLAREAKIAAYEAMAADDERTARIRRNTRSSVAAGLL